MGATRESSWSGRIFAACADDDAGADPVVCKYVRVLPCASEAAQRTASRARMPPFETLLLGIMATPPFESLMPGPKSASARWRNAVLFHREVSKSTVLS